MNTNRDAIARLVLCTGNQKNTIVGCSIGV